MIGSESGLFLERRLSLKVQSPEVPDTSQTPPTEQHHQHSQHMLPTLTPTVSNPHGITVQSGCTLWRDEDQRRSGVELRAARGRARAGRRCHHTGGVRSGVPKPSTLAQRSTYHCPPAQNVRALEGYLGPNHMAPVTACGPCGGSLNAFFVQNDALRAECIVSYPHPPGATKL